MGDYVCGPPTTDGLDSAAYLHASHVVQDYFLKGYPVKQSKGLRIPSAHPPGAKEECIERHRKLWLSGVQLAECMAAHFAIGFINRTNACAERHPYWAEPGFEYGTDDGFDELNIKLAYQAQILGYDAADDWIRTKGEQDK